MVRATNLVLLNSLLVFLIITFSSSSVVCLQIPDQTAAVGRVFYYRFPLDTEDISTTADLVISETTSGASPGLPEWLHLKRHSNRIELIGLPSSEHKRMHFFHVKLVWHNGTRLDDVFVLDIVDASNPTSPSSATSSSASGQPHDCILRLTPTFSSVDDVWKVLSYLMPAKLAESIDGQGDNEEYNGLRSVSSDPTVALGAWLADLVTVTKYQNDDGRFMYSVTLDRQDCDPGASRRKSTLDEVTVKLRKMGIDYHLIKIVRSLPATEGPDSDMDEVIAPTRTAQYTRPTEEAQVFRRRHQRRHIPAAARATPALYPSGPNELGHFSTVTILGPEAGLESKRPEVRPDETLTRIVPTLTTPVFAVPPMSSMVLFPSNEVNEIPGAARPSRRPMRPFTTPIPEASFPTDYDMATPVMVTPTPPAFTFHPASIRPSGPHHHHHHELSSDTVVVPTPVVQPPTETSTTMGMLPTGDDDDNEVEPDDKRKPPAPPVMPEPTVPPKPTTSQPGFPANSAPTIKKRIRKLQLQAGTHWKFTIPSETFMDIEDGGTRSLELGFFLENQNPPPGDFWVQFNTENQFLYALPTEANVGKHTFHLMAIDSGGQMVTLDLELHVRQHGSSRAFHHEFFLYDVTWDQVKYPVLISATERLLLRIANQVYGDGSIDAFAVQTIEATSGVGSEKNYTVSWTNVTLPQHPCPKTAIHSLYSRLGDLGGPVNGFAIPPSKTLVKVLASEFKLSGVGLRFQANCGGTPPPDKDMPKGPEVRNPVELLQVKQGDVFRYKIPEDTFVSSKGGNARELELSVLTIDGHTLPLNGAVGFNAELSEIQVLFLDTSELGPKEYQLIAREDTGVTARDAFIIEFLADNERNLHGFEITMAFLYQPDSSSDELSFDTKMTLMWKIAQEVLSDADPTSMKVISLKKLRFTGQSSRKKREAPQYYYEVVWTNKTRQVTPVDGRCPSQAIQDNIVSRIFKTMEIEKISNRFEPDFRLLHVAFRPTSKCVDYMSGVEMGVAPVVVIAGPGGPKSPGGGGGVSTWPPTPIDTNAVDEAEREYYVSSILPALITIAVMLVVALIIVIVLVRYRRQQEKRGFDVHGASGGRTPGDGFPTERDAFLGKGRVPVIFESELQQQQLLARQQATQHGYGFYSPVVMQPPASPGPGQGHYGQSQQQQQTPPTSHHQLHQMTPMRSLQRQVPGSPATTYAQLAMHQQQQQQQQQQSPQIGYNNSQRRQPPPYYRD